MKFDIEELDAGLSRLREAVRSARIDETAFVARGRETANDADAELRRGVDGARLEDALSLARAQRELDRVLRLEHGHSLARAALIRASRTALFVCLGRRTLGRGALGMWRAQWNELCVTTRASELRMPSLLRSCATDDVDMWPSAVRLAREALVSAPSLEHRRVLATCLLAEGRIDAARELRESFELAPSPRGRGRVARSPSPTIDSAAQHENPAAANLAPFVPDAHDFAGSAGFDARSGLGGKARSDSGADSASAADSDCGGCL